MPALARNSDPLTSDEAAEAVPVNRLEQIVLNHLGFWQEQGRTSHELALSTGLSLVSISPRMKPLEQKNLIVRTAERRQGRIVWKLAERERTLF
jgi:DNA-binding HxlR family transcriptional regulator